MIEQLKQSHADELEVQWSQLEASKEAAINQLEKKNRKEQQEQQRANQLAVRTMKDNLSQQNQVMMEEMRREHTGMMTIMRKQYLAEKEGTVQRLDEDHRRELERLQRDVEMIVAEMKREV